MLGLIFLYPKINASELCREQLSSSPLYKRIIFNSEDKITTTEGISPIFFIDIDSTSFQIFPLKKDLDDSNQTLI